MKIYAMERDLSKQTKLTKTLEFILKTISNFKAAANFLNFLSFKKEKRSCNKSVKFYYSTQKYDSITTYFPFLKGNSPQNWMLCLHNACGIFRKFSWLCYLYLQMWSWWVLFIHETFLVYKLETFKNCKEVKRIWLWLLLFDQ